ncbi:hypothetical protein M885DRAFT_559991 [Pelagophyceae sp. CCMP2097]|nr:hypothetical protein M885DRAFT_559991 [Pelagophyceae sp. CCMP2097]
MLARWWGRLGGDRGGPSTPRKRSATVEIMGLETGAVKIAEETSEAEATLHVIVRNAPSPWPTVTSCFGIFLALGLGTALLTAIALVVKDLSWRETAYEQKACDDTRAAITTWGEWTAGEAYTIGVSMLLERELGLGPKTPFLLPGPQSAQTQLWRMMHVSASHSGISQITPSIIWNPTVLDEDRETYETFVSNVLGRPINISNIEYVRSQGRESAMRTPAQREPVYHPMSYVWSVLNDAAASPETQAQFVGFDYSPVYRKTPAMVELLVHRRHVARAPAVRVTNYLDMESSLDTLSNDLLLVDMPFCGLGDCADNELVGFFTFLLSADDWSELFPNSVKVKIELTRDVVKTPVHKGGGFTGRLHSYEPFLGLDMYCYYVERARLHDYFSPIFALTLTAACTVVGILALLAQDHRQHRRTSEARWKEENKRQARERREVERVHAAKLAERSEANERMERYVNHEIKNRLVVLSQLCSEEAQLELVDEMAETLNEKMVLVRLSSACYTARLDETMDLDSLIDKRLQRHRDANCAFMRAPTTGAAAAAASALRLDSLLVKIVMDNILSNAFKYGSAACPPSLAMHIEPDGIADVGLVIELTNWAGPEHAALLTMGEAELNRIAGAEGERAHTSTANTISSGDGFPMAVVAARALGGTLKLKLSKAGVVARFALSKVALGVAAASSAGTISEARHVDPSQLSMALVDDSLLQRKVFQKFVHKIAPHGPPVVVAGDTRESIDGFAQAVCDADVDVVFSDQNFAPVHHTKAGTDIICEIRARDAAAGCPPRLIFISSGNDSPEDAAAYVQAGADGSLSKITLPQLKLLLERHATTAHPRFKGRRTVLT